MSQDSTRVALSGYLDVPTQSWQAVLAALPAHIALSQAEPGCLHFSVTSEAATPYRLLVDECFVDRAAFEAHQARTRASDWARVTAGMARHYQVHEG